MPLPSHRTCREGPWVPLSLPHPPSSFCTSEKEKNNSRMPPQLEKNHVVPTAWQDEALARDGVSREVPVSVLKCQTVPDTFHATPRISPTHRVPSRETPRVPTPLHLSPFSPPDGDRSVDSPAWSGRDSRPSRRIHILYNTSLRLSYT